MRYQCVIRVNVRYIIRHIDIECDPFILGAPSKRFYRLENQGLG